VQSPKNSPFNPLVIHFARAAAFDEDFMELVEIFCGFLNMERFSRINKPTIPCASD
jgi:hypothetical protein